MLNTNQVNSLKHIYQLFSNIIDNATIWADEINENDNQDIHLEKLSLIMNVISDYQERIEGEIDDIIIIVEENLKEFILERFSREQENEEDTETDEENIYH